MENESVLHLTNQKFSDLYLCFCGHAKCKPLHSFGPAVRPFYLMHYILEGQGIYQVGERRFELKAGEGFLIEPEVQTFYQADRGNPWTYIWIGFDGENAGNYLREMGLNSHQLTFRSNYGEELENIVLQILENNTHEITKRFLRESLLYSFFSVLHRDVQINDNVPGSGGNPYILQAMEFIRNNYGHAINVSDIAEYVCINRSYLYTLFKRHLYISPQAYLTKYRLTRAAELLVVTEYSVESITMSCGYSDSDVFSRAFKSVYKMTPTHYRKEKGLQELTFCRI